MRSPCTALVPALAIAVMLLVPAVSRSAEIRFYYEAVITLSSSDVAAWFPEGALVHGVLVFQSDAPGAPDPVVLFTHKYPADSMSVVVPDTGFSDHCDGASIFIRDVPPGGPGGDLYAASARDCSHALGERPFGAGFLLEDPTAEAFDTLALPLAPPDLAAFAVVSMLLRFREDCELTPDEPCFVLPGGQANATLTRLSLVPEPHIPLLWAGLLVARRLRRRPFIGRTNPTSGKIPAAALPSPLTQHRARPLAPGQGGERRAR